MQRRRLAFIVAFAVAFSLFPGWGWATPPVYNTFGREQRIDYEYVDADLLRIWIVYVGQGDGILIQLPKRFNYDPDPDDEVDDKSERSDILIDGGSFKASNQERMLTFLQTLYDPTLIRIENAIITHHDADHILGMISILNSSSVSVNRIYHNGLASYRYKGRIKTAVDHAVGSIADTSNGKITRVLALLESDKETIKSSILINDINALRQYFGEKILQGNYSKLAKAILEKEDPEPVGGFPRVWEGGEFIPDYGDINFRVILPRKKLKKYKSWGETINGNSVTFLLKYREFEMLFTGDQNEYSEKALMDDLNASGRQTEIQCDVLKAPHHGSAHNIKGFFKPNGSQPVITVASMGDTGFGQKWKHPSTNVVQWAGGAHRFYSTYIHEKKFRWEDMLHVQKHEKMLELTHVLIETDGLMFRVMEVDAKSNDLSNPMPVRKVQRSDGTRWIKAKP